MQQKNPVNPAPVSGDQHFIAHFLVIFFLLAGVLTAALNFFHRLERNDYLARLETAERYSLQLQQKILAHRFENIIADLLFLAGQNELTALLAADTPLNRRRLGLEYQNFASAKKNYDQIRFLDNTGMETVRVNFSDGMAAIVPDQELRSQADCYYFQDAIELDPGKIFVSPLDLNIEQGKLSTPHKPMIRFATPIFDRYEARRGVVILSFQGDQLLGAIRESARVSQGEIMLLNSAGFWLLSPKPEDEWGFMLPARQTRRFGTDYPEIWSQIHGSPAGLVHSDHGLFSFITLSPLSPLSLFSERTLSSTGSSTMSGESGKQVKPQDYYWKLVSLVPQRVLESRFQSQLNNLFMLAVILYVLSTLPAWFLAKALANRAVYQQQLYQMAHYDALTELPNRTLFLDRLHQALRNANRYKRYVSLLYVDLDDFKEVNDELGHSSGDILLRSFADRLLDCVRRSDTVSRLGGDEFAILLPETDDADHAAKVAQKIMGALSHPFNLKGVERSIHASIGISIYPDDGDDPEKLLKNADSAMYRAKQHPKNCYRFHQDKDKAPATPRI